jgi:phospholipid methyltransferase
MWGASYRTPKLDFSLPAKSFSSASMVLLGVVTCLSGVVSFRRAKTTVNPTKPDATSSLVVSGIYKHTRNPMYVGFVLVLLGWAAFLSNLAALTLVPVFIVYIRKPWLKSWCSFSAFTPLNTPPRATLDVPWPRGSGLVSPRAGSSCHLLFLRYCGFASNPSCMTPTYAAEYGPASDRRADADRLSVVEPGGVQTPPSTSPGFFRVIRFFRNPIYHLKGTIVLTILIFSLRSKRNNVYDHILLQSKYRSYEFDEFDERSVPAGSWARKPPFR